MSSQILFYSDWDRFPNAIIDENTNNSSFRRICELYKNMGIINHAFPLQLLDPELKNIDVHDEKLMTSQELQLRVSLECSNNHFYYLREVARIPSVAGNLVIRFNANRANISMSWLFFNHITNFIIQPRQSGKSHSICQLLTNICHNMTTNSKNNWLTKDETLRAKTFAELKDIHSELPEFMQHIKNTGGISNSEELYVKSLGNKLTGLLANASPKLAEKLGRGLTSPINVVDELAFIANLEITLPAMLANMITAADVAKAAGVPYGAICATTAGKLDDRDGAFAYSLIDRAAIWDDHLFDCRDEEDLRETILKSCKTIKGTIKTPMVNSTFSHRQLGYTDDWLREKAGMIYGGDEAISRDLLNHWTRGGLSSALTVEQINSLKNSEISEPYIEIDDVYRYTIRWNINKEDILSTMNRDYHIISADTSDLSGGDDTFFHFVNVRTGRTTATAMISESLISTLSTWIAHLLVRFKRTVLILERKSSAVAMYDILFELLPVLGEDPFRRLYNKVVQNKEENREAFEQISLPMGRRSRELYITHKKAFGFITAGFGSNARSILYGSVLRNMLSSCSDRIHDVTTITQLCCLEKKNDRIDHASGSHDDSVISRLLADWLLSNGRNLSFYGIDSSEILSDNRQHNEVTLTDIQKEEEQNNLRDAINDIYQEILNTKDELLTIKLEKRLMLLASYLDKRSIGNVSIDQMLINIKSDKRTNRMIKTRDNNSEKPPRYSSMTQSSIFGTSYR